MKTTQTLPGHIYKSFSPKIGRNGQETGLKVELNNGHAFISDKVEGTVGVQTPEGKFQALATGSMKFSPRQGLSIATKDSEMTVGPEGKGFAKDLSTAVRMVPIGPIAALLTGLGGDEYVDRSASMLKGYDRRPYDGFTIDSSDGRSPDTISEANLHGSGQLARATGLELSLPGRRTRTKDVSLNNGQTIVWMRNGQTSQMDLPVSLDFFATA
jgi:hypothetical protein